MERRSDRFLAALSRLTLRLFFRRVELQGLKELPRDGPLLIVANHGNSLVDPMILFGFLPRPPRFLAKSTLWQHPIARYMVRLGAAIPVYRRQDQGDMSRNQDMFERCYELLAKGGSIAMFPEGTSHAEPRLGELRTGAARIVLGAEERFGPLEIRIVPVGLTFDERHMFRSSLLVHAGDTIDPIRLTADQPDPKKRVQQLTQEVERALLSVTLNYESWHEAELIELATEVFLSTRKTAVAGDPLARRLPVRQQLAAGYQQLQKLAPVELNRAIQATRTYQRLLRLSGVRDDQVNSAYGREVAFRFVTRTLRLLFWTLPLAAVGLALNLLPFLIPRAIVAALRLSRDQQATYKVLISIVLFPLVWILTAVLATRYWGPLPGAATLALAPLSGYIALVFIERGRRFLDEVRAFWLLRTKKRISSALREQRTAVAGHLEGLLSLLEGAQAEP